MDGAIEILVDIFVRTVKGAQRRVVRFSMAPSQSREEESIFLPAEIVKGMGKRTPNVGIGIPGQLGIDGMGIMG